MKTLTILLSLLILSACTNTIEKIVYIDSPEIIEGTFPCESEIGFCETFEPGKFSCGKIMAMITDTTWKDLSGVWDFERGTVQFTSTLFCMKYKVFLW